LETLNWPLTDPAIWQPQQITLYSNNLAISAAELDSMVDSAIIQIREQGIRPGGHIGCSAHNSLTVVVLLLACLKGGWVYAPLNPRYPATQQQRLMDELDLLACLDQPAELPKTITPLTLDLQRPPGQRFTHAQLAPERRASLILTSGSSGHPKAVAHRLQAHLANASASQSVLPLAPGCCWLLSLPLFHIGGMAILIRSLLHGSAVALPEPQQPLLHSLRQLPVTHISLVATQLYRLLQEEDFSRQKLPLTHLMLGGGPVSDALLAEAKQRGFSSYLSYGMTETASQIITGEARLSGVQPHIRWRIQQEELQVTGTSLFEGYYRHGSLHRPVDDDGYFATRDKAVYADGTLSIIGRIDNLFISGGENIQPEEIEQQLLLHPNVAQAMVVTMADAEFGQRPVAVVNLNPESTLSELEQWLKPKLAGFKRPARYLHWPQGAEVGLKPSRKQIQAYADIELSR